MGIYFGNSILKFSVWVKNVNFFDVYRYVCVKDMCIYVYIYAPNRYVYMCAN